jgi:hypothetical protein
VNRVFGVGYGKEPRRAKDVPARILATNECVGGDPEWTIGAPELAGNIVGNAVRTMIKPTGQQDMCLDEIKAVSPGFCAQGVRIMVARRDVWRQRVA